MKLILLAALLLVIALIWYVLGGETPQAEIGTALHCWPIGEQGITCIEVGGG